MRPLLVLAALSLVVIVAAPATAKPEVYHEQDLRPLGCAFDIHTEEDFGVPGVVGASLVGDRYMEHCTLTVWAG